MLLYIRNHALGELVIIGVQGLGAFKCGFVQEDDLVQEIFVFNYIELTTTLQGLVPTVMGVQVRSAKEYGFIFIDAVLVEGFVHTHRIEIGEPPEGIVVKALGTQGVLKVALKVEAQAGKESALLFALIKAVAEVVQPHRKANGKSNDEDFDDDFPKFMLPARIWIFPRLINGTGMFNDFIFSHNGKIRIFSTDALQLRRICLYLAV